MVSIGKKVGKTEGTCQVCLPRKGNAAGCTRLRCTDRTTRYHQETREISNRGNTKVTETKWGAGV
jgi:hypothetical protein